ncbi:hypothetical protein DFH09DRAFT_1364724 [Mycena vulgaris]|nr:hypothetical protein DFH09DRAFT_1364724 [Mycena vulgaris]
MTARRLDEDRNQVLLDVGPSPSPGPRLPKSNRPAPLRIDRGFLRHFLPHRIGSHRLASETMPLARAPGISHFPQAMSLLTVFSLSLQAH